LCHLRSDLAHRHDVANGFQEYGRGRNAGNPGAAVFLGNLRAAFIVALIIPLSLLATFIGLTWRGIPANLLSLGAMDFGIIVDGAVIVVENVFRRLGELKQPDKVTIRDAIEQATFEVGRPTFFSMLIIIAAIFRFSPCNGMKAESLPNGLDGDQRVGGLAAAFGSPWCRCCVFSCCARKSPMKTMPWSGRSKSRIEQFFAGHWIIAKSSWQPRS